MANTKAGTKVDPHARPSVPNVHITEVTAGYWRITFDNPPINLFDPNVFAGLRLLLDRVEADAKVRVLVFDSANPDYYISHLDVERITEVPDIPGAASLTDEWHHFVTRLAHSPVLSIASIRGRVRGIGNEFVLACDMRFASKEKAILAQPEVGFGVVPGGGGIDWLPRLVGRSRALEIIAGGQDFDADTAERYGWINRALPDDELDTFVDELATRIGGFERRALATAKRLVNERSSPASEGELLQSFKSILEAIKWPETHARMAAMKSKGWGKKTEAELNHPYHLGLLAKELSADAGGARTTSDLLALVLDSHGGLERWRQVRKLRLHAHIAGELWGRRGQEGILKDAYLELDAHTQRLVFHGYTAPDRRGVFEVSRTAIETEKGEIIEERTDPAARFAGQTTTTHWDNLDVVYTAGFDLWNYFTAPFVLTMPGVRTEEIEPWEEAGEKWRRLKAVFPEGFVGHAPEQVYSFNSAGLLRRFEYQPKLRGVPANVNYAADHKQVGGLVFATRRRMLPSDSDGRSRREPVLMTIDVLDVQVDE